jgi:divalent metal cation (Fe/Co/Zn/Cd) transporter
MISAASPSSDLLRRAARLQLLTIAWMTVEAIAAIVAAWMAQSPALLGFGGDSVIELFSATVVLWRFRTHRDAAQAEKLTARVAGGLLFLLAAFVLTTSTLSLLGYGKPRPSSIGIVVLVLAAAGMPWLASQKRKLASQLSSASLRADSAESALCGYLSLIALAGLMANSFLRTPWADPVAALVLVPLIVKEAREALRAPRLSCGCAI